MFVFNVPPTAKPVRSYGDGATAESLIRQTGEAGNRTCAPWFTRHAVYSLHHSGSYITDVVICQNLSCVWLRNLLHFLTEDVHILHNDCVWSLYNNRLFRSPIGHCSQSSRSHILESWLQFVTRIPLSFFGQGCSYSAK